MQVSVLGPVEVVTDDRHVRLDAPKERAALVALALQAGRPVPVGGIVDAVWGDRPPATASKTLQGYISSLRRRLGAEAVETDPGGYTLLVDRDDVDLCRFEDLLATGRQAARTGEDVRAGQLFADAIALWRGPPLADCADGHFRQGQITRLEELLLVAREGWLEAELALGHHVEAVPELEALVAAHPLHEPLWALLMLALYRCGRQADALRAYRRLRRRLGEDIGIEPSLDLQRLESRILRQDERLDQQPPPPPDNLPAPLSSLVGRTDDARRVAKAVLEHRLVTLVGIGGVGKTRLALEAGRVLLPSQSDGVWWVDLTSIQQPGRVSGQVASALGGLISAGDRSSDPSLVDELRLRQLLLILDNCEQVADETADLVVRLLEAAPGLTVLATSRVELGVPGELHYAVQALTTPTPGMEDEEAACTESVRLFVQRAEERSGRPQKPEDLPTVAEICRRLDGVPLAIELAAARVPHLSPSQILQRLDDRFDLLNAGPAGGNPRHQTLRISLDWSYDLLDEPDQRLFDRLAVFPADFDLDAAIAVGCSADTARDQVLDGLSRLVDRSLVEPGATEDGDRRFRLLETLRAYGREHLDGGDLLAAQQAHADHFRAFARSRVDKLEVLYDNPWVTRTVREAANLRAAIEWSFEHERPERALEFAPAVVPSLWADQRICAEVLERMLQGSEDAPDGLRARALLQLEWPSLATGRVERSIAALDEAIDLFGSAGDERGRAIALSQRAMRTPDSDANLDRYREVLDVCNRLGLDRLRGSSLTTMTLMLVNADRLHDIDPAWLDEAERIYRSDEHAELAGVYFARTMVAWAANDLPALEASASVWLRHSIAAGAWPYRDRAEFFLRLAQAYQGQPVDLEEPMLRTISRALASNNLFVVALSLRALAGIAASRGRASSAARLWGAGAAMSRPSVVEVRRTRRFIDSARMELGDRFDEEVEAGRRLTPAEAVELAFATFDSD